MTTEKPEEPKTKKAHCSQCGGERNCDILGHHAESGGDGFMDWNRDWNIHRYARKIAAALYYREKGKPIGVDFVLWTYWTQATDAAQMSRVLQVANMSPFTTIGTRSNLKFGDRFSYKFDQSDENNLFTAVAQFGKGLVLVMMVADSEAAIELQEEGDWIKASAMFN